MDTKQSVLEIENSKKRYNIIILKNFTIWFQQINKQTHLLF